jgi:hypothetical protein
MTDTPPDDRLQYIALALQDDAYLLSKAIQNHLQQHGFSVSVPVVPFPDQKDDKIIYGVALENPSEEMLGCVSSLLSSSTIPFMDLDPPCARNYVDAQLKDPEFFGQNKEFFSTPQINEFKDRIGNALTNLGNAQSWPLHSAGVVSFAIRSIYANMDGITIEGIKSLPVYRRIIAIMNANGLKEGKHYSASPKELEGVLASNTPKDISIPPHVIQEHPQLLDDFCNYCAQQAVSSPSVVRS